MVSYFCREKTEASRFSGTQVTIDGIRQSEFLASPIALQAEDVVVEEIADDAVFGHVAEVRLLAKAFSEGIGAADDAFDAAAHGRLVFEEDNRRKAGIGIGLHQAPQEGISNMGYI